MYCLTRKTLKCKSWVQKICLFLQKETWHCKNSLALDPQRLKQYIFGCHFYSKNAKISSNSLCSSYFMLENIKHHHFTWSGPNLLEIVNFVPIAGLRGPKLNWNKFTISFEFDPLQVKWWYHMFSRIKMEEYMEPEFSGIFWVKMVAKDIVLGSPGTHFMRINSLDLHDLKGTYVLTRDRRERKI